MCRWVFYYGDEVCISKIIYGAYHGLANMADGAGYTPGVERDIRRNHEVNVHGCGIGWYGSCPTKGFKDAKGLCSYSRPCCYTTIAAPSHDRNLRSLSKAISTSLLFGHVRAAGPGASVHEYNCHPFYNGRYMFMHNGEVSNFKKIRRMLLATLRDDLFEHISGTTDSEVLFALVLNQLPDTNSCQTHERMENAVKEAMCVIMRASRGKSSSMNLAFTDGETVVAARYRNSTHEDPPSLYFHLGPLPGEKAWDLGGDALKEAGAKKGKKAASGLGGFDKMMLHGEQGSENRGVPKYKSRRAPEFMQIFKKRMFATQSMLVSSEPLSMNGLERWQLMPPNSIVVTHPMAPTKGRCSRKEFLESQQSSTTTTRPSTPCQRADDEQQQQAQRMSPKLDATSPVLYCEFKCLENLERIALSGECSSQQQQQQQHTEEQMPSSPPPLTSPLKSQLSTEFLQMGIGAAATKPINDLDHQAPDSPSTSKTYQMNHVNNMSKQGLQYSDSESESLYAKDDVADSEPTPMSKGSPTFIKSLKSKLSKVRASIDSADCGQQRQAVRVPQYGLVALDEDDATNRTDTPSPPIHYGGDGVIFEDCNLGDFYKNNSTPTANKNNKNENEQVPTQRHPTSIDILKRDGANRLGESSSYTPDAGRFFGLSTFGSQNKESL